MIRDDFHVELCEWQNETDRAALCAVREEVFVREQNVSPEIELDEDDPRCTHALARATNGTPVGCGRLLIAGVAHGWAARETDASSSDSAEASRDTRPTRRVEAGQDGPSSTTGRIGRMAVLKDWRGRGVGAALLRVLLEQARARGLGEAHLHAQIDAVPFYLKHGFAIDGNEFIEAGIRHLPMRLVLAAREALPRVPPLPRPVAMALRAQTREQLIEITRIVLSQTRRVLCVLVRELDPELLNDSACLVELRRIAISGRGASIRILAGDLSRAQREGNRLLDLARRLPSVIQFRRPIEDVDLEYPSAFMCNDNGGFLLRPLAARMETTGSTCEPGRAAQLQAYFDAVWERAESCVELRALKL